jgi:hypothetical protein
LGTDVDMGGNSAVFLLLEVIKMRILWSTDKVRMVVFFCVDGVFGGGIFVVWGVIGTEDESLRAGLFLAGSSGKIFL